MLAELSAGEVWTRLYPSRFPEPLGFGFASSRFSDPQSLLSTSGRFGVIYFGKSLKVCFAEAILRERGVGGGPSFPIELKELQDMNSADIEVAEPLRLVDFRKDGMLRMRIPTDTARAASHDLGQAWSRAIWLHGEKPDGIIYESRLNGETNIAVFDRGLSKIVVKSVVPLLDRRAEMAQIFTDFDLSIVV